MKIERFPPNRVKIQREVVLILRLRVFGQSEVSYEIWFFR
jgi:hypothetical protein